MGKLFDPNRNVDNSYMMRMSQAIAEHRGVFVGLCLAMVLWFGLGGFALRNEGVGEARPLSSALRGSWSPDDFLFWGSVAGAFVTLVGGWIWFHRQMESESQPTAADSQAIEAEIARFKEEKTQAGREERLRRLREQSGNLGGPKEP